MEKNYYEILEVDKNASPEIIKKAYNTLTKKYHPDLQSEDLKDICEEKFKLINEAYETLSVPEKREKYNFSLKQNTISKEDYEAIYLENIKLKNMIKEMKNTANHQNNNHEQSYHSNNDNINKYNYAQQKYYNEYMDNIQQAKQQAYRDAYIQDLKNRGYKIRHKKTFKEYFKNFIALCLTALILFILWQIPFIRNTFINNILF